MRKYKELHQGGPVGGKEFKRLVVRQVSLHSLDAPFQEDRVSPVFQHLFIIVCLQEGSMALAEMVHHLLASRTYIRENTCRDPVCAYRKTMGLGGVMHFGKVHYAKIAGIQRDTGGKRSHHQRVQVQPAVTVSCFGNINRYPEFPGEYLCTPGMIGMLVRDENCFYLPDGQPKPHHPPLRFSAGDAGIDQHGIRAVADIVTVSVAT